MLIDPYSPALKIAAIAVIVLAMGFGIWRVVNEVPWNRTEHTQGLAIEFKVTAPLWNSPVDRPPRFTYRLDRGALVRNVLSTLPGLLIGVVLLWLLVRSIRHPGRPGACPKCNYSLRGSHEPGCPECGWGRKRE